jgi:hypothetical protein
MAKSKNKKNNKKQQKRSNPKANFNAFRQGSHLLAQEICALSNPFCEEARGAKWPDGSMTKSVPYTGEAILQLGTPAAAGAGAGTNNSCLIVPNFQYVGQPTTDYDGVTGIAVFGTLTYGMAMPSGVARYRLLSCGIKIIPIVPKLSASGVIRIRLTSPLGGTSLQNMVSSSMFVDAKRDYSLATDQPIYVVLARTGEEANLYRDTNAVTDSLIDWVNPGFQAAQISITGVPVNTACVEIQLIYHFELVFKDNESGNFFATPSPPTSTVATSGATGVLSKIGNFIEGGAAKVDALFQSRAFKYIASLGTLAATENPQTALTVYQGADSYRRFRTIQDVD